MKLVTNNPKFKEILLEGIEVEYFDIDYLKILAKVRDYVHENWEVLTHPLYGSVKPNETIYRSIVIKEGESLDFNSVNLMSEAIGTFEKFQKNKKVPEWTERVKDDFSVIDYDLLTNAIKRII